MPFEYHPASSSGPLRQGEILANVWEHRPRYPPIEAPVDTDIGIESLLHPRVVVMTADCDLLWDYEARFEETTTAGGEIEERNHSRLLPHVLLLELFERGEIRGRFTGLSEIWRRVEQNQDERYHRLTEAKVQDSKGDPQPSLYLDFKKTFALPTDRLYDGLRSGKIGRIAVMPPIYLHDLMHRFYGFLGRVGLPD